MLNTNCLHFCILFVLVLFMTGCEPIDPPNQSEVSKTFQSSFHSTSWPRIGKDVEVLYSWGRRGRNRLDTVSGTLTKDLLRDGIITIPFELTVEQKTEIAAIADSLEIWYWPTSLYNRQSGSSTITQSPCSEYLLKLKSPKITKTLVWDSCTKNANNPWPFREKIKPLEKLIETMIKESAEYKSLPPSRGSPY